MRTKIGNKVLILGLIMAVMFSFAFGFGSFIANAQSSDAEPTESSRSETINYYIEDSNGLSVNLLALRCLCRE